MNTDTEINKINTRLTLFALTWAVVTALLVGQVYVAYTDLNERFDQQLEIDTLMVDIDQDMLDLLAQTHDPSSIPPENIQALMNYALFLTQDGDCQNDWLTHMTRPDIQAAAVNWALQHDLCDNPEYYSEPGWVQDYFGGE